MWEINNLQTYHTSLTSAGGIPSENADVDAGCSTIDINAGEIKLKGSSSLSKLIPRPDAIPWMQKAWEAISTIDTESKGVEKCNICKRMVLSYTLANGEHQALCVPAEAPPSTGEDPRRRKARPRSRQESPATPPSSHRYLSPPSKRQKSGAVRPASAAKPPKLVSLNAIALNSKLSSPLAATEIRNPKAGVSSFREPSFPAPTPEKLSALASHSKRRRNPRSRPPRSARFNKLPFDPTDFPSLYQNEMSQALDDTSDLFLANSPNSSPLQPCLVSLAGLSSPQLPTVSSATESPRSLPGSPQTIPAISKVFRNTIYKKEPSPDPIIANPHSLSSPVAGKINSDSSTHTQMPQISSAQPSAIGLPLPEHEMRRLLQHFLASEGIQDSHFEPHHMQRFKLLVLEAAKNSKVNDVQDQPQQQQLPRPVPRPNCHGYSCLPSNESGHTQQFSNASDPLCGFPGGATNYPNATKSWVPRPRHFQEGVSPGASLSTPVSNVKLPNRMVPVRGSHTNPPQFHGAHNLLQEYGGNDRQVQGLGSMRVSSGVQLGQSMVPPFTSVPIPSHLVTPNEVPNQVCSINRQPVTRWW